MQKKITISIEEQIYKTLRHSAIERGITASKIIENLLKQEFSKKKLDVEKYIIPQNEAPEPEQ